MDKVNYQSLFQRVLLDALTVLETEADQRPQPLSATAGQANGAQKPPDNSKDPLVLR